jgi:hypothetical protein
MALLEADPPGLLYHIGREPEPLAWAEWQFVGGGRFDDPELHRAFRVLYAAEQRLAAFVETLQQWRPSIEALTALDSVIPEPGGGNPEEKGAGVIPADWHLKRGIATLRLQSGQRWLDLREHETREALRVSLAATLHVIGFEDFDLGDALSRNRRLTQAIGRFAFANGFHGIAYRSRFDGNFDCWAVFEGARSEAVAHLPITKEDSDLREAARRFNLTIPM